MRDIRRCEWCKGDFVPRKKTNKYCGNDCYEKHRIEKSTCEIECESCSEKFTAKRGERRKYCSSSCAAKRNNVLAPKRKPERVCEIDDCDGAVRSGRTYCNTHKTEHHRIKSEQRVKRWLAGLDGGGSDRRLWTPIRKYLLEQANYECQRCGFNTPHPDDGNTILEIDHINGDGSDHRPENLAVLCPNCHALTSTYRARNMGNGRKVYYLRVEK